LAELDYTPLFTALAACGRPIAVFDEDKPVRLPGTLTRRCPAGVFTTPRQSQAGFTVGQYLLSQGHRRVAYLSTSHDSAWSQERLAGVTKAFKLLPPESVCVFAHPSAGQPDGIGYERSRSIAALRDELTMPWSDTSDELRHEMTRALSGMAGQIGQRIADNSHADAMVGLCKQALGDDRIDAWVASHDRDAAVCSRFLGARPGPARRIELVSFDDSTEACVDRISSYNFNSTAVQRAMVSFLLDGGTRADLTDRAKRSHSIEGFLTLRG
jgi:DNA-binding LacI/PurR family transcriptional regulator